MPSTAAALEISIIVNMGPTLGHLLKKKKKTKTEIAVSFESEFSFFGQEYNYATENTILPQAQLHMHWVEISTYLVCRTPSGVTPPPDSDGVWSLPV